MFSFISCSNESEGYDPSDPEFRTNSYLIKLNKKDTVHYGDTLRFVVVHTGHQKLNYLDVSLERSDGTDYGSYSILFESFYPGTNNMVEPVEWIITPDIEPTPPNTWDWIEINFSAKSLRGGGGNHGGIRIVK